MKENGASVKEAPAEPYPVTQQQQVLSQQLLLQQLLLQQLLGQQLLQPFQPPP